MSAYGEIFIREILPLKLRNSGLLKQTEDLKVPENFYDIVTLKSMPKEGVIEIEDNSNGIVMGSIHFKGFINYSDAEYEIKSVKRVDDYLTHLKPIIEDFRDNNTLLNEKDLENLLAIIEIKLKFYEGLVSEEEYQEIINREF